MNVIEKISSVWFKLMAKQLRRPSGLLANITGNKMNKSNELLYQLTLNNLNVKDGDNILEIGFGNGKFFSEVYEKGKNLTISGIDHSSQMVTEAVRKNRDLFDSGVINLTVGSSDCLPYDNNHFDIIFCVNVIYFWENPSVHLREIHRVLRPGGSFCVGFRPKENLSKFPFAKFGFIQYNEEELKYLLEENGFKFINSQNGKKLEILMDQNDTPFESICMVFAK